MCQRQHPLNAQSCPCGHVFRTQFVPPNQTVAFMPPQPVQVIDRRSWWAKLGTFERVMILSPIAILCFCGFFGIFAIMTRPSIQVPTEPCSQSLDVLPCEFEPKYREGLRGILYGVGVEPSRMVTSGHAPNFGASFFYYETSHPKKVIICSYEQEVLAFCWADQKSNTNYNQASSFRPVPLPPMDDPDGLGFRSGPR